MQKFKEEKKIRLSSDDEMEDMDEYEDDEEDEEDGYIILSLACEDCDYRWEVSIEDEEEADQVYYCPMCGSSNTTQI